MNTLIKIGSDLWFEGTYLGGTLHFQTESSIEAPEGLHFQVGISFNSLLECYNRLGNSSISWKIRDQSLTLFGDQEELHLHFCNMEQPGQRADHVVRGRELKIFRYAIHALASHITSLLN